MGGVGRFPGRRPAPAAGWVVIGHAIEEQLRVGMLRQVEKGPLGGRGPTPTGIVILYRESEGKDGS